MAKGAVIIPGLAVDDAYVYWTTSEFIPPISRFGSVYRAPKDGTQPAGEKLATGFQGLARIVEYGPAVYFTSPGDHAVLKLAK